jgi:hypothetical protein
MNDGRGHEIFDVDASRTVGGELREDVGRKKAERTVLDDSEAMTRVYCQNKVGSDSGVRGSEVKGGGQFFHRKFLRWWRFRGSSSPREIKGPRTTIPKATNDIGRHHMWTSCLSLP